MNISESYDIREILGGVILIGYFPANTSTQMCEYNIFIIVKIAGFKKA